MTTIGVHPVASFSRHEHLWAALSRLETVRFEAVEEIQAAAGKPLILDGSSPEAARRAAALCGRVLNFANGIPSASRDNSTIRFSRSAALDPVLRGQNLRDSVTPLRLTTRPDSGAEVLGFKGADPVWIRATLEKGILDVVAYSLPMLDGAVYLFQHFRPNCFMALLPLLHFIREVAGDSTWQRPPLRACFMFDDPNLHWRSFGHINYRDLVESAKRHHYHVSFATIPLDAWFIHQPTAELFREHASRISLLIHGNDHTARELARPESKHRKLQLGAQALKRIERFENRSRIEVSRVMAAPHAACDETMAGALARLGFEAACISRSALMSYNPDVKWPATMGLNLAEFSSGLPVIPRFGLAADCWTEIVLAAFMGQAIIMVGHHWDLAGGYGLLEQLAGFINRLGPVRWMKQHEIARSNYLQSQSGDTLRVCAFSRRVELNIPEGAQQLMLDSPWRRADGDLETVVVKGSGESASLSANGPSVEIPVAGRERVELQQSSSRQIDYRTMSSPPRRIWPVLRRVLSEGRDRLQPLLPKRSVLHEEAKANANRT